MDLSRNCLILPSAAKVGAGTGGRETENEDRNSIKLDGWHVSFVGNGRCRFIAADIIPTSYGVCVCYVLYIIIYNIHINILDEYIFILNIS